MKKYLVILLITFLNVGFLYAQDSTDVNFTPEKAGEINKEIGIDSTNNKELKKELFLIKLLDGSEFIGTILQQDSINIVMKTDVIPKIVIPVSKIKSIKELSSSNYKNEEYWFPNPNSTRYLVGPSAFTLKKSEAYYQNTYLFLNSFNVGVTDNITIGGGFDFISLFSTSSDMNPIVYFTPKVGFELAEKINIGAGVLYIHFTGTESRTEYDSEYDSEYTESRIRNLGIVYSIITFGSTDDNITCGFGKGFVDSKFNGHPIISVSAMKRLTKRTAFVSENWFFTDSENDLTVLSYGIRFFGETMTVDLSLLNNRDIIEVFFIGFPYIDFVVKF